MARVAILLDISNLYYTLRRHREDRKLDFEKFLEFVADFGPTRFMIAYGSKRGEEADRFIQYLRGIGFEPKYKDVKEYVGESTIRKANWDVGIAMDVVERIDDYDTLILGTADGDMAPVVQWATQQGKRVIIFGCRISRELQAIATCIEIPDSMLEAKRGK